MRGCSANMPESPCVIEFLCGYQTLRSAAFLASFFCRRFSSRVTFILPARISTRSAWAETSEGGKTLPCGIRRLDFLVLPIGWR